MSTFVSKVTVAKHAQNMNGVWSLASVLIGRRDFEELEFKAANACTGFYEDSQWPHLRV